MGHVCYELYLSGGVIYKNNIMENFQNWYIYIYIV